MKWNCIIAKRGFPKYFICTTNKSAQKSRFIASFEKLVTLFFVTMFPMRLQHAELSERWRVTEISTKTCTKVWSINKIFLKQEVLLNKIIFLFFLYRQVYTRQIHKKWCVFILYQGQRYSMHDRFTRKAMIV